MISRAIVHGTKAISFLSVFLLWKLVQALWECHTLRAFLSLAPTLTVPRGAGVITSRGRWFSGLKNLLKFAPLISGVDGKWHKPVYFLFSHLTSLSGEFKPGTSTISNCLNFANFKRFISRIEGLGTLLTLAVCTAIHLSTHQELFSGAHGEYTSN